MIGPFCRVHVGLLLSWKPAFVVGQMLHGNDDDGATLRRLAVGARLFSRHLQF